MNVFEINPYINFNWYGVVNLFDILLIVKDFGKTSGFNAKADLNNDNVINLFDVMIVVKNWSI